jgi:hypothetical protein
MPVFYRNRCLVCEDEMRRKREDQRFKIGHNTCKNEYQRFRGLAESDSTPLETLDSSGSKVDPCAVLPRKMFWREKKGRGWYWEPDLGECRLPSSHSASRARRPCQKLITYPPHTLEIRTTMGDNCPQFLVPHFPNVASA